jgi:peptide deformylase
MQEIYAEQLVVSKSLRGKAKEIVQLGHPILKQQAQAVVDPRAPEIQQIVADMLATINEVASETVAGLAAPQINILLNIILFQVPEQNPDGSKTILPYTIMLNPKLEAFSNEQVIDWEGCVSIPGLVGAVPRAKQIRYSYQTINGKTITCEATNLHARIIQHEIDHLAGIIFLERMTDLKQLYFTKEFQEFVVKPNQPNVAK